VVSLRSMEDPLVRPRLTRVFAASPLSSSLDKTTMLRRLRRGAFHRRKRFCKQRKWFHLERLSRLRARFHNYVGVDWFASILDCKTVGFFFLKISKEIGKACRNSLTRAKRASLTASLPRSRSLFAASFQTFCLTARALEYAKIRTVFCSLLVYQLFFGGIEVRGPVIPIMKFRYRNLGSK